MVNRLRIVTPVVGAAGQAGQVARDGVVDAADRSVRIAAPTSVDVIDFATENEVQRSPGARPNP